MAIEKSCATCDNQRGFSRAVCINCGPDLHCFTPLKEPMSKAYDAAFRENLPGPKKEASDGSTAGYYTLPEGAKELQDLISHKDMNAQMGEIFRAVYRFGEVAHSPKIRDIKKIIFYAQEELKRLEKLEKKSSL